MAITLVQSTSTGSPAATSLAYSSNNTAGNLLVCIVTGFANGVSITVPTDTQGNTWNLATSGTTIAIFYAMNCRAGANTVTPADHGSGIAYEIAEFSGIATSSALDQAATGGSGQFPISVTTTANGELIIGMQIADAIGTSTPPTITVGSGLTADLNPIGTWVSSFPNGWSGASGYETQTNSGSFSMSKWTVSGPNSPSIQGGAIATFKAGGAVNGNATLTGLSLTSAAGQPIAGAIPFGQSLTSTQGTVSATGNGSATLTGVSLTSAMGQPIAGAIPFGQSLTTTEGSLFGSVTAPIIGQSLTTTPGAVFASSAVLTGQSLTASQGTLSATGGGNASLAGQSLTSAANSPVGGAGVALAGNSLSLAQGGITARFSGYTVVQQKSAARFPNSTTASQSVAFTSANTAANALFCLVMYQRGSGTNSEPTTRTVTDDQSNTWVELQHGYNSSTTPNAPQGLSLWMCSNPKGGVAPNVTATIFGSATWGFIEVRIAEISGGISWAADGGVATTFSSSGTITSGTFTTANNGDLIIGGITSASTITAGSGFALVDASDSGSTAQACMELQLQGSASASTTVSFGVGSSAVSGVIIGAGISSAQAALLQGASLTSAANSPTASVTASLAGVSLTSVANSVIGEADVPISGASLATATGTVTTGADGNATPDGQALTLTQGFVSVAQVGRLSGLSVTAAANSLSPTGDGNISLTGQALTFAQGSVSATNAESATLTGLSLSVTPGLIGANGNGNGSAQLTGEALSIGGSVSAQGDGNTPTVSGQSLTSAANNPTATNTEFATLNGLALTSAAGTLSIFGDGNASLALNALFIQQGTLAGDVTAPIGSAAASSPISLVQNTSSEPLATNPTLAFVSDVTAGNLLIVAVNYFFSGTVTSVADSQGNMYTACGSELSTDNLGGFFGEVFFALAGSTGANTVTINSTSSVQNVFINEFSGVTFQDQLSSGFGAGTAVDSGGVITHGANELLFGFYFAGGSTTTQTPGTGWTALDHQGASLNGFTEYQIVSSTGTYDATATLGAGKSGSPSWGAFIVTFNQFFVMSSRAGTLNSSGDGNADLTSGGASLTSAQGTFSATGNSASTPLSGADMLCVPGTLIGNPEPAIAGASLSSATNALVALPFAILPEQALTASNGVLSGTGDGNVNLTGNALSAVQGAIVAANLAAASLSGAHATVSQGTLTFNISSAIGISGKAASVSQGTMTANGGGKATLTGAGLVATPGLFTQVGILRISTPLVSFAEDFGQPSESVIEDISSGAVVTAAIFGINGFSTITNISTGGVSVTTYFGVQGFTVVQG